MCEGNCLKHCCIFAGNVCQYLEEYTMPGRHWVCGLYRIHGNWEGVHMDLKYEVIRELFDSIPGLEGKTCGGWPHDYDIIIRQKDCDWYNEE